MQTSGVPVVALARVAHPRLVSLEKMRRRLPRLLRRHAHGPLVTTGEHIGRRSRHRDQHLLSADRSDVRGRRRRNVQPHHPNQKALQLDVKATDLGPKLAARLRANMRKATRKQLQPTTPLRRKRNQKRKSPLPWMLPNLKERRNSAE